MSLRIIEWPDFLKSCAAPVGCAAPAGCAMTIGVFDGVHLGHQALIKKITERGPNPTVVTFRENPKKVISPQKYKGDIFSLRQKLDVFEQMGISRLILIDFSEEFSKLKGWEFLNLLEERGKMSFLAIGSNFRCGYRQDTDAEYIEAMNRKNGIPTEVIPPVAIPLESGIEPVNSSRIRSAIISGDIRTAAALMGRNFELDISDIKTEEQVYDICSAHRILPACGQYQVIVKPGGMNAKAFIQNGKLRLEPAWPGMSLEFLGRI